MTRPRAFPHEVFAFLYILIDCSVKAIYIFLYFTLQLPVLFNAYIMFDDKLE